MGIEMWPSFLMAAVLVIIVPGPATIYVSSQAHTSARNACYAIAGIVAGDLLLISIAGLGLAELITRWPPLLLALKLSGALYIGYLGVKQIRASTQRPNDEQVPTISRRRFSEGLMLTLLNPKPIIFFGAFFPLFISKTTPGYLQSFYVLGAVFLSISAVYLTALTVTLRAWKKSRVLKPDTTRSITRLSGWGLLACSAMVTLSAVV